METYFTARAPVAFSCSQVDAAPEDTHPLNRSVGASESRLVIAEASEDWMWEVAARVKYPRAAIRLRIRIG